MLNYCLASELPQNFPGILNRIKNTNHSCPMHYLITSSFSPFYYVMCLSAYFTHALSSLLRYCAVECWLLYLAALATNSINTCLLSYLQRILRDELCCGGCSLRVLLVAVYVSLRLACDAVRRMQRLKRRLQGSRIAYTCVPAALNIGQTSHNRRFPANSLVPYLLFADTASSSPSHIIPYVAYRERRKVRDGGGGWVATT